MNWTGIIVIGSLIIALIGGAILFLPGKRRLPLVRQDGSDPTLGFRDPFR